MLDILILSNGPGEIATWVRPVVAALRHEFDAEAARISVILSPCPNAGGREAEVVLSYSGVDRSQSAKHFWNFLLWGKTADQWDWHEQGIVICLGGEQIFPVLIGKRLGYKTLLYGELAARWPQYIDRFAVMNDRVLATIPTQYQYKATVVGDLMLETGHQSDSTPRSTPLIGLLPGSKAQKLQMGLPFSLAIATAIKKARPDTEFIIPVAPAISIEYLAKFADSAQNPVIAVVQGTTATLVAGEQPYLQTAQGLKVALHQEFPAYDILGKCMVCLTTIGANTAELAALGIPMVVLLPTYQLDAMRSWDGIPGILARLPGLGTPISKLINWITFKQLNGRKFAWPNIWAGREIVPELVGKITVAEVATLVIDLLDQPAKLEQIRTDLAQTRGSTGAAARITKIVQEMLSIYMTTTNLE
jgi:lipid A disaccharide synthetase